MADVLSTDRRSYCMSRIRGSGNRETELRMISLFRRNRITGWRRRWPLFGKPDFVFPALRVAVFVDGCFWHGCPEHYIQPRNNRAFWKRKLQANRARDRYVDRELRQKNWRVVRVWEHDLRLKKPRCIAWLRRLPGMELRLTPALSREGSGRFSRKALQTMLAARRAAGIMGCEGF